MEDRVTCWERKVRGRQEETGESQRETDSCGLRFLGLF